MLSAGGWKLSQANLITFVLVDSAGAEVAGLGTAWTLQISKAGGAFAGSAGTKAEIGSGVYKYLATSGESDTVGPVFIKITHASIVQQNCEYVVESRAITSIEFTYTVTDSVSGLPIEGVQTWFCIDAAGTQVVWYGVTDAFGITRDSAGNKPRLDPGVYTIVLQKAGYVFVNDTETVSA